MRYAIALIFVLLLALTANLAVADYIVRAGAVNADSDQDLAAEVRFAASGTNLIVTLSNTSMDDVMKPTGVLTAVFFTLAGDPDLAPQSAVLGFGSVVHFDDAPDGGVVGGEWSYGDGFAGAPWGADEGIGSTGFGLFNGNHFLGPDLDDPLGVDGLNYGITSPGDNLTTGNGSPNGGGPVNGKEPLIQNSVIFTLDGLPVDFVPGRNTITDVSFQYGTELSDPNIVPEPGILLLLGSGLVGLAGYGKLRFRRRKK